MLSCWNANPKERPPFSELVTKISGILEPLADYMDFSSFALSSQDVGTNSTDGANAEITDKHETETVAVIEDTSIDAGLPSYEEISQDPFEENMQEKWKTRMSLGVLKEFMENTQLEIRNTTENIDTSLPSSVEVCQDSAV